MFYVQLQLIIQLYKFSKEFLNEFYQTYIAIDTL